VVTDQVKVFPWTRSVPRGQNGHDAPGAEKSQWCRE